MLNFECVLWAHFFALMRNVEHYYLLMDFDKTLRFLSVFVEDTYILNNHVNIEGNNDNMIACQVRNTYEC